MGIQDLYVLILQFFGIPKSIAKFKVKKLLVLILSLVFLVYCIAHYFLILFLLPPYAAFFWFILLFITLKNHIKFFCFHSLSY